jgi:hypothetical protein
VAPSPFHNSIELCFRRKVLSVAYSCVDININIPERGNYFLQIDARNTAAKEKFVTSLPSPRSTEVFELKF